VLASGITEDNHTREASMDLVWNGNTEHTAEHGISQSNVEHEFENPTGFGKSRSTGAPAIFGHTAVGRYIIVVYVEFDE